MSTETNPNERLLNVDEMAAKLQVHRDTVLRWASGSRPRLPAVKIGQTVRFHWPTIAKKFGITLAFLLLLSPTTPAASPTFPEPAASPASRSAAGAPLSSAMRRDPSGGSLKPRVGTGRVGIPELAVSDRGQLAQQPRPGHTPAPPSLPPGGGRWHGIDLDKLAHAESRSRDGAVGASGERGRLQITRAALADVNRRRRSKVRFATLTNAATSVSVARDYIDILAGRIRRSGHEPSPAAILCAWNDGFADARRYGFAPDRAPYPTRRLIAAQ
jgi:excisionase family DNA binding protein